MSARVMIQAARVCLTISGLLDQAAVGARRPRLIGCAEGNKDRAVDAEVDLGTNSGGYVLRARLNVSLPGIDREVLIPEIENRSGLGVDMEFFNDAGY
jgi:hypothetical protein